MAVFSIFSALSLVDNGIVLSFKNGRKREISYSDLDKIYIKVYKIKPIYEFMLILFPFILVYLSFQFMMLEKVVFVAFFSVIPVFVKTYKYKGYGLEVCLKDGTFYRKKISLRAKSESITLVNVIKKEQLSYYYKTKGLQEKETQFHPNKAS